MTAAAILQVALGTAVFVAVVARLADLGRSGRSVGCIVAWNLWVTAHVMVALGAVCLAIGLTGHAAWLGFAGIALQIGVRLKRRGSDA